ELPTVVDARRGREHHRRIRYGAGRRLGHREARADFSFDERKQKSFALLRRRVELEQIHVAFVGRGAMQRERPDKTAAGLLEDNAHADGAEPEAAVLARKLW